MATPVEPIAAAVIGANLPKWAIPAAAVAVVLVGLYLVYRANKPALDGKPDAKPDARTEPEPGE